MSAAARILIFLGLERRTGGGGPTLFSYDKNTGEAKNEGALFGADSPLSWSTGEGWYFSATQPNTLYVNLTTSPQLQRYDVITHALTTVFDVSSRPDLFGSQSLHLAAPLQQRRPRAFRHAEGRVQLRRPRLSGVSRRHETVFLLPTERVSVRRMPDRQERSLARDQRKTRNGSQVGSRRSNHRSADRNRKRSDGRQRCRRTLRQRLRLHAGGRQLQPAAGSRASVGSQRGYARRRTGGVGCRTRHAGVSDELLECRRGARVICERAAQRARSGSNMPAVRRRTVRICRGPTKFSAFAWMGRSKRSSWRRTSPTSTRPEVAPTITGSSPRATSM